MKLHIEKFEIEITPEDQKLITEFLTQRDTLLIQREQADSASRMSAFGALVPVLMQIFSRIIDGTPPIVAPESAVHPFAPEAPADESDEDFDGDPDPGHP